MSVKYSCDKCGKEIKTPTGNYSVEAEAGQYRVHAVVIKKDTLFIGRYGADLCDDCTIAIVAASGIIDPDKPKYLSDGSLLTKASTAVMSDMPDCCGWRDSLSEHTCILPKGHRGWHRYKE